MLPNKNQPNHKNKGKQNKDLKPKPNFYWIYIALALVFLTMIVMPKGSPEKLSWLETRDLLKEGSIQKFRVINNEYVLIYLTEEALNKDGYEDKKEDGNRFLASPDGAHFKLNIGDPQIFENNVREAVEDAKIAEVSITYEKREDWFGNLLGWILPIGLIVLIWIFLMKRFSGGGGPGGQIFNIGKSKAQLFDKDTKVNIFFKDVAGLEEAKVEIMEIVDFLKHPKKYTKLGGKIPKGALLVGPPGTGKTLLAKAVAGEAGVPFFSMSGSDFVEMFVGVGASRVRDLFKQAKEKAPCIIFIDEIDAIGRARGKNNMQGGNDERENTLNQLLTEMDGFSGNSGVIMLAATNRPDVLDSALLRPGRFDRQISIDKPDIIGREQIFKVHLKSLKLADDIETKRLASLTPGFAGAEIANICNEAALIAARNNKEAVEFIDFQNAIDRVIGGLEKKNKIISPEEKKIIAFHEAGHAVTGWFLEHAAPLLKVSIVPRGVAALGYAQYLPNEQYLYTKEQMLDTICMALGGRVAEELTFGKISTGAQNDLERVTRMVYDMITIYGMNDKVGHVSFNDPHGQYNFKSQYSAQTAQIIDQEARLFIQDAYKRTMDLLTKYHQDLNSLAEELLEKEIVDVIDLKRILGERPFKVGNDYKEIFERNTSKVNGHKPPKPANNEPLKEKNDEDKDEKQEREPSSTNTFEASDDAKDKR